ncbi:MAG TPA: iron-containing alcohol dehydrogenase [Bacilli bacterium]|nr:iron-containing alcohol dehydrogenase [Bacilli bacterium]
MHNFEFHLRTKLYFGRDEHLKIGEIIKGYGFSSVLILIGERHVKETGLLDKVSDLLGKNGIKYTVYGGITPNPEIKFVREATRIAQKEAVDLILAIGGGSVIDVAKTVSASYYYKGDPFDFCTKTATVEKALPLGVILTHSSSGSEMSASAVISRAETLFKEGYRSELIRPLFAVMNPRLTQSVSKYQTAVGIVDSFMHSLERYFSNPEIFSFADRFNEAVFITLKEAALKLIKDPNDYDARANIMLASAMSHNGLGGLGKKTYMSAHQLEHALSALYPEIAHGHGLAVVWPAWAKMYLPIMPDKFDRFARVVFNFSNDDKIKNGLRGIEALENLFAKLGLTLTLRNLGVKESDYDVLVNIVTKNGEKKLYHRLKELDKEEIRTIYQNCY